MERAWPLRQGERALLIHRRLGDRKNELCSLKLLGRAYLRANRPEEARDPLTKALRIAEELKDALLAAEIRAELATVTQADFGTAWGPAWDQPLVKAQAPKRYGAAPKRTRAQHHSWSPH